VGRLPALNEDQRAALEGLAYNVECISGPPGTGKSTTICHIIASRIAPAGGGELALVCAVRNKAIEAAAEKLELLANGGGQDGEGGAVRTVAFPSVEVLSRPREFPALCRLHIDAQVAADPTVANHRAEMESRAARLAPLQAEVARLEGDTWQWVTQQEWAHPHWEAPAVSASLRELIMFSDGTWPGRERALRASYLRSHPGQGVRRRSTVDAVVLSLHTQHILMPLQ
jgi:hypothetical protein